MKLIFATILFFTSKALASSENEGSLRGAVVEPADLDRELLSVGSTSTSLSFSVASAESSADSCFNAYEKCLELGDGFTAASTYTEVEGNAFAVAYSEQCLWLEATCHAYAEAHALACAFTKLDGDIKVSSKQENGYKDVSMTLSLRTATKTIAFAESQASAESYANVGTHSFTTVAAFCAAVNNKSILCGGVAGTELTVVGSAVSGAFGASSALAKSGSVTSSLIQVSGRGSSLDYLNGLIRAYAKSWSFANAASLVAAFANAYVLSASRSFAAICVEEHGRICADSSNHGKGICSVDATEACAEAAASGVAFGAALSQGCAESYAEAVAVSQVNVAVSANVACKSTPQLTWQCTNADADTVCYA